MKFQGCFNDITNEHTYWICVGRGVMTKQIQDDADTTEGTEIICFGADPITISSDISDTFENIYIRTASINLVTNYDIRQDIVANNYTDIPIEIRYDNEEGDIIFFGFVSPLSFNQSFDKTWNEFTLECFDRLGMLEYMKFPPLLDSYDYNTPRYFIDLILSQCKFPLEEQGFTRISYDYLEYDCTNNTKINPIVFVGESQDDWLNCKEVLEEIGKIYGCYFYQDGNVCMIENVMLFDLSNPMNLTQNEYAADDTNISIQEAYNRIECQVDLVGMKETLVDPFAENSLEYIGTRKERVLTELMYNPRVKYSPWSDFIAYKDLIYGQVASGRINWLNYPNYNDKFEVHDYYCQIMQNNLWNFGTHNYLNDGYGSTGSNVYRTLEWLYNNPGKGAFLAWTKTDNQVDTKQRGTLDLNKDVKEMLVIQVGGKGGCKMSGEKTIQNAARLTTQFNLNNPICSIEVQNANNFIPNDVTKTNFLVISGSLRLNPLQCRTGYHYDPTKVGENGNGSSNSDIWWPWMPYVMSRNTIQTLLNEWNKIEWWHDEYYYQTSYNPARPGEYMWTFQGSSIPYNNNFDNGLFYNTYCWDNIADIPNTNQAWPFNQTPNFTRLISCPYLSPNTCMGTYQTSSYIRSNSAQDVNGITKCAILACELSIGEGENKKYLIENLDVLQNAYYDIIPYNIYTQLYQWKKLDECPINNGVRQTWFTIGVNPDRGDYILGRELKIQNTVSPEMKLPAGVTGTAIPITSTDKLQGKLSFKILGPYNAKWNYNQGQIIKHGWEWWKDFGYEESDRYIMDYVDNIQITNFEIKPYANGELSRVAGYKSLDDKDLVYYSDDSNEIYKENKNYSCKLCTCLTADDATEMGITFGLSNSTILNLNDTPFYGITYKGTNNVKLEQARVSEHYNIWKRPRSIVETTLKLIEPEKAYLRNNYTFNYLKYKGTSTKHIYRTLARDIDLKYNNMTCTMKEISDYNPSSNISEIPNLNPRPSYDSGIGSFDNPSI